MAKLLTEPRLPKEITAPKKRIRKKKDPSVPSDIKYTVINEGSKADVNVLLDLFKEDPLKARVKFFNTKRKYSFERTVLFEKGKKDFEFLKLVLVYLLVIKYTVVRKSYIVYLTRMESFGILIR